MLSKKFVYWDAILSAAEQGAAQGKPTTV